MKSILTCLLALLPILVAASSVQERVAAVPAKTETTVWAQPTPSSAPLYLLEWWSVNDGGPSEVVGSEYGLGLSVGQNVTGSAIGTDYGLQMGFWAGIASCPIQIAGDVNLSGSISPADIIVVVSFVLKAGPDPEPCVANGDVNCSGSVTTADIVHLVNLVFKAGPEACNTCNSPLATGC